ncbi:Fc.00g107540.m01.CDS01 [Cosmosporella sp. VM-42]
MHGYSSSEESEDPRRPHAQPAASTTANDQKKKKKKKLPPQQSINRIWKKFSKRKFHTALAVLPFDPVAAPASSEYPNEFLSAGYERAAEECRRKVQKIIKECKRVNMRYRDPGFDLDWDLKYEKGHCLNSLGQLKFELNRTTLLSSKATVPKAVKRVHEIFEKPTFMKNVNGGDVKQGSLGDCWIMAGLTALANVPGGLERICVAHDAKIGIYGFVFYRDGEWIYSIIDDKLYLKSPCWDSPSMQRDLLNQIDREDAEKTYRETYQTGSKALFFAQCKDQNETWVPLFEKAYAKAHGDYASLAGGWIGEGLEDISGGVTTELLSSDILDIDEFWESEMSKVNEEFLFGASTGLLEHGYGERDGISEGHAYVVINARTLSTGQRLVKLRNPWGKIRKGIWEGAWSDGSKEWTKEAQEELDHKFGSDSVFWIPYEDLIRKYSHFDRTRLFRDPEWRSCQRWIGVDVPWKAEYHEKFQIKLSKDSPLVLVLSQLDGRYFKGLQGQYNFRLHFRVHEQDSPNAEDYIVRSHGNYLMDRSVSVELPDMPAGNYAVYLKVTGERDSSKKSVEDVVKRELLPREENEKLAQVGYAFDLAHSKAWDHLDKVVKLRKKTDQKKASGCRQSERRKLWEKRHVTREVTKKQSQKNQDKKRRKREEWDARQARLEEEEEEVERKAKAERDAADAAVAAAKEAEDAAKEKATEEKTSDDKVSDVKVSDEKSTAADDADDESEEDSKKAEQPDAGTNDDSGFSVSTSSPLDTPKSEGSSVSPSNEAKEEVPPVNGPPPPPPAPPVVEEVKQRKPRPAYDSAGESSDSPVEDWEVLYSSDDMTRKPRLAPHAQPAPRDDYDTEEEKMPDPWNAICIVGIRVYSKDAQLELRTVMEGGELLEGGMGEKGAADLDNAQANAGGTRGDDKEAPEAAKEPGFHLYPPVIRKDGKVIEDEDKPTAKHSAIRKYIRMDSQDSTRFNTPEPTPLESDKRLEGIN